MPRVFPSQIVTAIDQLKLPFDNNLSHGFSAQLAGILALIDQLSPELIVLPSHDYSLFVVAIEDIRQQLARWRANMDTSFSLRPRTEFEGINAVGFARKALLLCADQSPVSSSSELTFIQDVDLRESLRQDLSEVNRALSDGEWKSATVLAGSLCESLLLWKLQLVEKAKVPAAIFAVQARMKFNTPPTSLEEWTLHQYLEVLAQLNVIPKETADQVRLAKDFRNLIHPGRAIRLGQKCDRGTALAATAAVELIIRDFTP